jgi:glycosyltransferase involved in cell wall biosynthesis
LLAVIESHPVQYHAPVYRVLGNSFGVPLTVIYGSDFSVAGYHDKEFRASFKWDVDLLNGYDSRFLRKVGQGGAETVEAVSTKGLTRAIREIKPTAILLNGYGRRFDRKALPVSIRSSLPLMFRGETTDHAEQRSTAKQLVRDSFLRWLYGYCSKLLYIGQNSLNHYRRLGCKENKLFFSPYCVDAQPFQAGEDDRGKCRSTTRRDLGIDQQKLVLLFSGKLTQRKGPDLLIRSLNRLPGDLTQKIELLFLGSGTMKEELEGMAKKSNLSAHFVGFKNQTDLSGFYHAADLLVLPSRRSETWGLVVNEAMMHGLPCVVSNQVGCYPDLIGRNETGVVFESDNDQALAEAVQQALPLTNRLEIRNECRARVAQYSVEKAASGIADAYAALAHQKVL